MQEVTAKFSLKSEQAEAIDALVTEGREWCLMNKYIWSPTHGLVAGMYFEIRSIWASWGDK
jgi:hypothetical protein